MKYVLMLLVMLCSFNASAGFKGSETNLIAKTQDNLGTIFEFYGRSMSVSQMNIQPLCAGRSYMGMTLRNGHRFWGCWWMVGERMLAVTSDDGLYEFDMKLVLMNDNFKEDSKESNNF